MGICPKTIRMEVGSYANLYVVKTVDFGVYLALLPDGDNTVLLPKRYITTELEIGDQIEVFIYRDSEDRIIATTLKPYAIAGEFACLDVSSTIGAGAFLDWGLPKDLFVPISEQRKKMEVGEQHLVYIYIDDQTNRLVATAKISRYLQEECSELNAGDEADILICNETDLGVKVIVNGRYWGMLFDNEIFQTLVPGQRMKAYVKELRVDGKLDMILQKTGYEVVGEYTGLIIDELSDNDGFLPLTDKSDPEDIYETFEISKKNFKKALGALYKQRIISIEKDGIRLLKK